VLQFTPLPGTAAEAKALKSMLKLTDAQVFTQGKASEISQPHYGSREHLSLAAA
jgi:hypothetical protein